MTSSAPKPKVGGLPKSDGPAMTQAKIALGVKVARPARMKLPEPQIDGQTSVWDFLGPDGQGEMSDPPCRACGRHLRGHDIDAIWACSTRLGETIDDHGETPLVKEWFLDA